MGEWVTLISTWLASPQVSAQYISAGALCLFKNIFGSDRSSTSHHLRLFVHSSIRLVQVCLELSIFIIITQIVTLTSCELQAASQQSYTNSGLWQKCSRRTRLIQDSWSSVSRCTRLIQDPWSSVQEWYRIHDPPLRIFWYFSEIIQLIFWTN